MWFVVLLEAFTGRPIYFPAPDPQRQESLNVRWVGAWPFGPAYAVAGDSARDLVFLGSGGGVYQHHLLPQRFQISKREALCWLCFTTT